MNAVGSVSARNPLVLPQPTFCDGLRALVWKVSRAVMSLFYFIVHWITGSCGQTNRAASQPGQLGVSGEFEALRAALRSGRENILIPPHLTASQFIQLLDEFPDKRQLIGKWACSWARQRKRELDPLPPYSEMAREAIRMKGKLEDFALVMSSIDSFGALAHPGILGLICKLDTGTARENPAFAFFYALTGISAYHTGTWSGAAKIPACSGILEAAWKTAQDRMAQNPTHADEELRHFFKTCFQGHGCLDIRVAHFEEYIYPSDFRLDVDREDGIYRLAADHFRVFRNLQVKCFCEKRGLNFAKFRDIIARGAVSDSNTKDFAANYSTLPNFLAYLQEAGNPIRTEDGQVMSSAEIGRLLTLLGI